MFTKESYSSKYEHTIWRCSRFSARCYGRETRAITKVINGLTMVKLVHSDNNNWNNAGKNAMKMISTIRESEEMTHKFYVDVET